MKKNTVAVLVLMATCALVHAQDLLVSGLDAYARSDWSSAILSFRKAATQSPSSAEAWYWLVMSEISAGQNVVALKDIDTFITSFPSDSRIPDIRYQQGRVLYLLGRYEESISTLYTYITSSPDHSLVPSAYYWTGECLFSVGRFEEARSIFSIILSRYTQSVKSEAASYRLMLIDRNTREEELLRILKTSHEESLKIIEDYQRREKTYEQAIASYQKKISDLQKNTAVASLEQQLSDERSRDSELLLRIAELEKQNAELIELLSLSGTMQTAGQGSPDIETKDLNDASKRRAILDELKRKAESVQLQYDQTPAGGL